MIPDRGSTRRAAKLVVIDVPLGAWEALPPGTKRVPWSPPRRVSPWLLLPALALGWLAGFVTGLLAWG